LITFLFFLRIIGQFLVAYRAVPFLPPMSEWSSGLIPYPILLPIQILILFGMTLICYDFARGTGFFLVQRRKVGLGLLYFSYIYFGSMVLRYIITMTLHPEQRWFGGAIPIIFHWILAAYIFTLGHFHTSEHSRRV
jgi:hypothetical protein